MAQVAPYYFPNDGRSITISLALWTHFIMDIIKLKWEIEIGIEGEDTAAANPLSRSLNRLFEDGQPFKRFTQCFFAQAPARESPKNYMLWWFGVFVLSQGDRVIFFPGLNKTKAHVQAYKGKSLARDQDFNVDHFSLEKERASWHITSQKSKKHFGSLPTADLGEGRKLWFGMSISSFSSLRPLSRRTSVVTSSPPSDVVRRMRVFNEAREGAKFQIIKPHPDASKRFESGFYHVSVIVGPTDFKIYKGENHGFPVASPFLTEPLPERILGMPVRYHKVSLSSDLEMQITTTKLPSSLRVPVMFTITG